MIFIRFKSALKKSNLKIVHNLVNFRISSDSNIIFT